MTKENVHSNEFRGETWQTELYVPKQDQWDEINSDMVGIYKSAFSYLSNLPSDESIEGNLKWRCNQKLNTIILLRNSINTIDGFSIAFPMKGFKAGARSFIKYIRQQYPNEGSGLVRSYYDAAKTSDIRTTAYIYETAISPMQQRKGLVGLLMNRMESELQSRGYTHLERDCMADNGYAKKVYDFYNEQEKIEYVSPVYESSIGNQVHFRIRL